MGKHYQKPVKPNEKNELRFILSPPPKGKLASGGKYSAHVEHDQTLGEDAVIGELADSIQPPLQNLRGHTPRTVTVFIGKIVF